MKLRTIILSIFMATATTAVALAFYAPFSSRGWAMHQSMKLANGWIVLPGGSMTYAIPTDPSTMTEAHFNLRVKPTHGSESGWDEWYVGLFNDKQSIDIPYGALFSQAQGYKDLPKAGGGIIDASTGLISGTYDGAHRYNYLETKFQAKANEWVHLIVVWTRAECRFYSEKEDADHLLAKISTNVSRNMPLYPQITNHTKGTTLFVDSASVSYSW